MGEMEAAVLNEWGGSLSVETVPKPDPGSGEVLVSVEACGISRGVTKAVAGNYTDDPDATPRIPGPEFAGVVEAVGAGVTSPAPGDRVLSYLYLVCGACDWCRRGQSNRCVDFEGYLGASSDGGYAEWALLPERNALPLPPEASFVDGVVAVDGLGTPLHVCNLTGVDDTDTVLVIGAAGRIGIHLSQLAARRGAHVLAADVHDERLAHVDANTGPQVTPVDARDGAFADRLRELSPTAPGPTVIVDTAGVVGTLREAWSALAMGGEVVVLPHLETGLGAPVAEYVEKEAAFRGSRYTTPDEVIRSARLLADGRVDPVVHREVGLEDIQGIHDALASGEAYGLSIVKPS